MEQKIKKIKEYIDKNYGETQYISLVGSRMWNWNEPNSDYDYFVIYKSPLSELVGMSRHDRSDQVVIDENDIAIHEIGKVTNMLYKNNINFVVGLFGDTQYDIHFDKERDRWNVDELRALTENALSKTFYMPINGLCYSNYKKYFINGTHEKIKKKFHHIMRYLTFGMAFFKDNVLSFDFEKNINALIDVCIEREFILKPKDDIPEMKRIIEKYMRILEMLVHESEIQENSEKYRDEFNKLLLEWRGVE